MQNTIELFKQNGYVHLKDFLDKDNCLELTQALNEYIKQNKSHKDDQCPISEAIHGCITFDKLLEDLLPHFEQHCGKRLYPTYSYARLYKPGEELKKHTDRPACEISATLTLGFEGDVWSIYMAGNKVDMQVGDAVLYRGMEIEHWREKYVEGQWQAQVFLHYVDADGPHANEKYDGRNKLGEEKIKETNQTKTHLTDCAIFEKILSPGFCDNIIKEYSSDKHIKEAPFIGDGKNIDTNIRDVKRVMMPLHAGIGGTLTATALNANNYWWKYNITHSNQSEFLIYKPEGHYQAHVDTFHQHTDQTRKITALAILNDDFEGGKFFIQTGHDKFYPPQEKGTILVFPSFILHGVEPVTKGTRYAVVTWLVGPYFK